MAIERMKVNVHKSEQEIQKVLDLENMEQHLCAISEEIFQKENEVGSGNFSRVYRDGKGFVYKKEKPFKNPTNNVHAEAEFLSKLIGFSEKVKIPFPVVSFVADIKRDKNEKAVRQSVIAMEEIKGFSIDKMLPSGPDVVPEVPFPEKFNPEIFFQDLIEFVKKMHQEKNIYHRDIADRNVMIEEATGMPVLIDFGDAVEFAEEFAEEGESDAYGRKMIKDNAGNFLPRTDIDLENIENLKASVKAYLTKINR